MNKKRLLLILLFIITIPIALLFPRGEKTTLKDFSKIPDCNIPDTINFCSAVDNILKQKGFPVIDYQISALDYAEPAPGIIVAKGVVGDVVFAVAIDLAIVGAVKYTRGTKIFTGVVKS